MAYIQENFDRCRDIKLPIVNCLSDLIMGVYNFSSTYVDEIIDILDMCFSAVYQLTSSHQDFEYVEKLKYKII